MCGRVCGEVGGDWMDVRTKELPASMYLLPLNIFNFKLKGYVHCYIKLTCFVHSVLLLNEKCLIGRAKCKKGIWECVPNLLPFEKKVRSFVR